MMRRNIGTILIHHKTRAQLKEIGRKGQTYDQVISELLDLKQKNWIDPRSSEVENLSSDESSSR